MAERNDIPELGKVYLSDDYNWLGNVWTIKNVKYKFCKVSASSLKIPKYSAVTVSAADIAAIPTSNVSKIGGIATVDIAVSTSDQYALFVINAKDGYLVNVNATATASADWSTIDAPLAYTGSGASALPFGKVSNISYTGDATGTTAQYTSAAWNATLLRISQARRSTMEANGVVSAYTGLYSSTYTGYSLPSGSNTDITGSTAYPASGELSVGDIITFNAQTRIVTAVNTGSAEATAQINSGFSATATGQTLSIGKMRVKSIKS